MGGRRRWEMLMNDRLGTTPDGRRVWAGSGPDTSSAIPLTWWACCRECSSSHPECLHPALAVVLELVAGTVCGHDGPEGYLCPSCLDACLALAEAIRGSAYWGFDGEGGFEGEVQWCAGALLRAKVPAPGMRLVADYDGQDWAIDYLREHLAGVEVSLEAAWHIVEQARAGATCPPMVQPRTSTSSPSRASVSRGEIEIAKRRGWPQPQRWELERRVREAAVGALNEAHFVQRCLQAGVRLVPKVGAPHLGVAGYSAYLEELQPKDRREFAGRSLAKDLALLELRAAWAGADPDTPEDRLVEQLQAWATWTGLCPDGVVIPAPPAPRKDGRWRWLHPQVAAGARGVPAELPEDPSYEDAVDYLHDRQGGACAMCQIRRHGWEATRGMPVPGELLPPGTQLDHDHSTGLVRGLLCVRCNTVCEPAGITARGDVWRAYTDDPPIGDARLAWPLRVTGRSWRML